LKTYELLEVSKRVSHELGYVRIRIGEVDKRIDLKRLGQRLADTYCLLLERGDLQIMLNGALLKPRSLGEIVRKDFRVRAASTIISGWVGTVDPAKRTADFVAGLRCYRLGRLVKDGEFFGHPTPAQEPGMAQLIGEVEVRRVPLTINKSDFDRDSNAWVNIERRLHRLLKPLVRELSRQTESPPPPSAVKVAQQVRRLLSQALRWADRPELFLGTAPGRTGVTQPSNGERSSRERVADEKEPSVPQPASDASPKRRGFGDIVIRPLGPAIRSQTVGGTGRRRAKHDSDLRHHAGHFDLVIEGTASLIAAREEAHLVGDARSCRVDQVEDGDTHLHRHFLDTQAFLYGLLTC